MFPFKKKPKQEEEKYFVIDEGVESVYSYHIKHKGEFTALCGHNLLGKNLPMRLWGFRGHLHEKYCSECAELMNKELLDAVRQDTINYLSSTEDKHEK